MKGSNSSGFLEFLMTDNKAFLLAVLYLPLGSSVGMFFLRWLIRGESVSSSLAAAAFIFLLACFIGIVGEIFKRKNLR